MLAQQLVIVRLHKDIRHLTCDNWGYMKIMPNVVADTVATMP